MASVRSSWRRLLAVAAAVVVPGTGLADGAPPSVETLCAACHGPGGNSVVPFFPRLAGQQAIYLEKQLRDFLAGKRKNDVMAPVLEHIPEADIPRIAAYYAAQAATPNKPDNEALVTAGQAIFNDGNTGTGVPACIGCHQPGGMGNERFPRLAGQHPAYAAAQLKAFKTGSRSNDKAKVMRTVAERLSDDEIAAVVEYLATQP
ncbi:MULTISPECIES: c-type cytochrome [Rubrivivax]|uniref:C-type cytochrome n=1 Tax=Rubrivivax benzoatilyticus TaxID=316997 RepID=A0ABX0I094_9BURK|nr:MULTISPECIES: c-type cytochrome [Rubrivivax]MCD0416842.1 c-type cytochrome [Rubrivivax sp. JA1024]EGJ10138.1 cytochrome c class I [Rubrivivax benzoatilyticus JA2 = ATCC BAA-35]MCC9597184.1 c-type cytochrome [Rubrivivax sp. JA1055]MCC9646557.1 c-type cytochrome [Rubrivivax sp. JA1029]NHL00121.1 c-type cytochrome [Rubrivivax benzoatilyticus]